jgi:hypothetical protein
MVERQGLGWAFEEPLSVTVSEFVAHLTAEAYQNARHHVERVDRSAFLDLTDTRDLLQEMDDLAKRK